MSDVQGEGGATASAGAQSDPSTRAFQIRVPVAMYELLEEAGPSLNGMSPAQIAALMVNPQALDGLIRKFQSAFGSVPPAALNGHER